MTDASQNTTSANPVLVDAIAHWRECRGRDETKNWRSVRRALDGIEARHPDATREQVAQAREVITDLVQAEKDGRLGPSDLGPNLTYKPEPLLDEGTTRSNHADPGYPREPGSIIQTTVQGVPDVIVRYEPCPYLAGTVYRWRTLIGDLPVELRYHRDDQLSGPFRELALVDAASGAPHPVPAVAPPMSRR